MRDFFPIESATFWKEGPDNPDPTTIGTEVFFMPAATSIEKAGSFTNTERLLQWHDQAIDPPGDCRSDLWFIWNLGRRMKQLYAGSTRDIDQGLLNLTWDYAPRRAASPARWHASAASPTNPMPRKCSARSTALPLPTASYSSSTRTEG